MPTTNEAKPLSPRDLANQLFDLVMPMTKNDPRETARQVILFLKEALVYAVVSASGDVAARNALLMSVAEQIAQLAMPPSEAPASAPAVKP
jgi:hypothetical protein